MIALERIYLFIYQSVVMESRIHIERNKYLEIYDINLDYLRKVDYNHIKKGSLEYYLYFMVAEDTQKIKTLYEEMTNYKKSSHFLQKS